jgi:soluble lytic murein transglycosylase
MSRLKGFAAAGLLILKEKPALRTVHDLKAKPAAAGILVLTVLTLSLVAATDLLSTVSPRQPEAKPVLDDGFRTAARTSGETGDDLSRDISGEQIDLYRDIFRLQNAGRFAEADAILQKLEDRSLIGHVLAQRYLHPGYRAGFAELKSWMERFPDHPQAKAVAKLARARVPAGQNAPLLPVSYNPSSIEEMGEGLVAKSYVSSIKRNAAEERQVRSLINTVRRQIQQYEPSAALRLYNGAEAMALLDKVEKDRVLSLIAAGYLYAGKLEEARRFSLQALKGSGSKAPMAGWVQGLAAWQQKDYLRAASAFEITAVSPYAGGSMNAGAAFWAARSHEKAGYTRRGHNWLEKAAEHPRTFYGILATEALGRELRFNWEAPDLTRAQEKDILSTKAGRRAERLLAAGQVVQAEAEIRALYIKGDKERKRALLAYASDRGLPSLSLRLAHAVAEDFYDAALYPEMPWTPPKGFRIDRALIHAIIRQESRFNPLAENENSGAAGLMQLMPRTANYVAGADIYQDNIGRALLKTPEVSLDIGQAYVEQLLNNGLVGQDLLSLAVAYNAGPGNLAKWKAERPGMNDPLLFIETIPFAETRMFVERVMANYWIYRARFDQPNESIEALADGRWARYASYDKDAVRFADAR